MLPHRWNASKSLTDPQTPEAARVSNRTLVELNHDYCPRDDAACLALGRALQAYMRAADRDELPQGVIWKYYRHHSEPCPVAQGEATANAGIAAQDALKDIASRAKAHLAKLST